MPRYGILTSKAPSLQVVANDIVYTLNKLGHDVVFHKWQMPVYDALKRFNIGIIIIPFSPVYAIPWFLLQRDYVKNGILSVTYVTVEGEPKSWLIPDWIKSDCQFIANSQFTKEMLKRVDVDVLKVIPHGINIDMVNNIKQSAVASKHTLKEELKAKVLYGTVASSLPRKGLRLLAEAIKQVSNKIKDAKFYVFTEPASQFFFDGLEQAYIDTRFGQLHRNEILKLIGSFDYYICSSLAEGFGLPLLEAQAFGVPCIYPAYSPLTEVCHPTVNFPIEVCGESFQDFRDGTMHFLHLYKPEEMAVQIEKTYETYTCNPDQYQKISQQVQQHAEGFDIMKTYAQFEKWW